MSGMNYLGLTNMRDYMNSATTGIYNTLAANNFHFDLMYNENDNLGGYITQVHNLEAAHPGSVLSLEGPNEVNGFTASASSMQQDLYNRANGDPLLAAKPVYAATLAGLDPGVYSQMNIAGFADAGNVHIYYNGGQAEFGWSPNDPTYYWTNWLKSGTYDVPGKPVVVTETGSTTAVGSTGMEGVDEPTQAKQILNSFMTAAETGTPMTYIYELAESHNNGPTDPESHFGLFRYDWTPKVAATAIHNFTTVLTDGGALAGPAGSLNYTIQGTPQWGGQMLFQEGDGTQDIVVWAEPDIWNDSTNTPIAAPGTPITIDLATAANVAIYDPLKGSTPVQNLGFTSHITFQVTDHPLIVEIKGAGGTITPTPTSPTPTSPTPTSPTPPPAPSPATAPPAPSAPDLTAASDTGSSSTDNLTKVTTPTLVGTAAAGSSIKLYDGATLVGTGTADGNGAWSVTTSTLASGSHVLTATAGNAAGVGPASAGLTVNIDTWPPSAPSTPDMTAASDNGVSNTDNTTSVTTPTFTGSVASAPNAVVTLYDGTTKLGSTTVDAAGGWSITSSPLAAGSHAITATATDVAGNVSTTSGALSVSITGVTSSPTPAPAPAPVSPAPVVQGTSLTGSRWNDSLTGTGGSDTIDGARGNDTIVGGAGNDVLTGGRDADQFVFRPGFGQDRITDFQHAQRDQMVFAGFGGVQPSVTDSSSGLALSFGSGDSVILTGVHSLSGGDWILA